MKIQILSDIHIEKLEDYKVSDFIDINNIGDVLILAGDIGSLYEPEKLLDILLDFSKYYWKIIYVPGNHEFYHQKNKIHVEFKILLKILDIFKKLIPNLIILNNSSVFINNVKFSGSILWCNPSEEKDTKIYGLDYKQMKKLNKKCINYLEKEILETKSIKHIIITHYSPLSSDNNREYKDYYYNDLEISKSNPCDIWIYGHTHTNSDKIIGKTMFICNQKGKHRISCNNFVKNKIIEV